MKKKMMMMMIVKVTTHNIQVGMQNSGLGVVLAQQHMISAPMAPVPCAISALMHSLIGSLLAAYWRGRQIRVGAEDCYKPETS